MKNVTRGREKAKESKSFKWELKENSSKNRALSLVSLRKNKKESHEEISLTFQ